MLIVSHRLLGVVGCVGTDELGARLEEHVLKSGFIPPLDLLHLVGIFFIQTALDVSIQQLAGAQRHGNSQQGVHLLALLDNLLCCFKNS